MSIPTCRAVTAVGGLDRVLSPGISVAKVAATAHARWPLSVLPGCSCKGGSGLDRAGVLGLHEQPVRWRLSAALKGRVANVRLSEPRPDRIRLIDVELHITGEHLDCDLPADRESINVADTPCGGARGDAVGCGKLDG